MTFYEEAVEMTRKTEKLYEDNWKKEVSNYLTEKRRAKILVDVKAKIVKQAKAGNNYARIKNTFYKRSGWFTLTHYACNVVEFLQKELTEFSIKYEVVENYIYIKWYV